MLVTLSKFFFSQAVYHGVRFIVRVAKKLISNSKSWFKTDERQAAAEAESKKYQADILAKKYDALHEKWKKMNQADLEKRQAAKSRNEKDVSPRSVSTSCDIACNAPGDIYYLEYKPS